MAKNFGIKLPSGEFMRHDGGEIARYTRHQAHKKNRLFGELNGQVAEIPDSLLPPLHEFKLTIHAHARTPQEAAEAAYNMLAIGGEPDAIEDLGEVRL